MILGYYSLLGTYLKLNIFRIYLYNICIILYIKLLSLYKELIMNYYNKVSRKMFTYLVQ